LKTDHRKGHPSKGGKGVPSSAPGREKNAVEKAKSIPNWDRGISNNKKEVHYAMSQNNNKSTTKGRKSKMWEGGGRGETGA